MRVNLPAGRRSSSRTSWPTRPPISSGASAASTARPAHLAGAQRLAVLLRPRDRAGSTDIDAVLRDAAPGLSVEVWT